MQTSRLRREMWGPWWSDPDPPEKPMTEAQLKRLAEGAFRLSQKAERENPLPPEDPTPWWMRPLNRQP